MPFWSLSCPQSSCLGERRCVHIVLAGNLCVLWERHDLGGQLNCLPVRWAAPSPWFCGPEHAWGAGSPAVRCVLCTSLVLPVSHVSLSLCAVSVTTAQVKEPRLELKLQKWATSAPSPGQVISPLSCCCHSSLWKRGYFHQSQLVNW